MCGLLWQCVVVQFVGDEQCVVVVWVGNASEVELVVTLPAISGVVS